MISKRIESEDHFILSGFLCFSVDDWIEKDLLSDLISKFAKTQAVYFVSKTDIFDSIQVIYWDDYKIDLVTVLNEPYPYSDCSRSNSRFACLNDCFKSRFRLSGYYYDSNETGLVHRNSGDKNQTVKDHEKNCFSKCKENCKLVYQITHDWSTDTKAAIFKARPVLSEFDFWTQFAGMACLFVGISFQRQLCIAVKFICSKVKWSNIRRRLVYLRLLVPCTGVIIFFCLLMQTISNFKSEFDYPAQKETIRNLIEPEEMHLVICVNLENLFKYQYKNKLKQFLEPKTLLELAGKGKTKLEETLDGVYLSFQNKTVPIEYHVHPKVIFRCYSTSLTRCFQLTINPIEPRYQMLLSISSLKIKFKTQSYSLYLLPKNGQFNRESFYLHGTYAFKKLLTKRSRSNGKCVDYAAAYPRLNCPSRSSCVERCINRRSVDGHRNISVPSKDDILTIDSDQFTAEEWATVYLNSNESTYKEMKNKCEQAIPMIKPCAETKFSYTIKTDQLDKSKEGIGLYVTEISLYFEVASLVETEPSWYSLALDILNIQSIVFGLSLLKFLKMIRDFTQAKLKLRARNKITALLIYLLCSAGFAWHTYHTLEMVIHGELTYSQHYEVTSLKRMPEIIFCFDYEVASSIDGNRKLTGNYLQELTSDLTTEKVFESIVYLENSGRWTEFNLSSVESFYFVNEKCFTIKIDRVYQRDQFHFSADKQVLRANFSETLIRYKILHFMTKTKGKMEFSINANLDFRGLDSKRTWKSYQVSQETFVVKQEDKFNQLKNPLSLFRSEIDVNDASVYLNRLLRNYKETCKLVTLNLALGQKLFHHEIRDDLFDQLYRQQNASDWSAPANLNYEREFVINHLFSIQRTRELQKPDGWKHNFSFGFVWFKKLVIATNHINYSKFILSHLNALSIWLDLGVLDLHIVLSKFGSFFIFIYKLFIKLKELLYRALQRSISVV